MKISSVFLPTILIGLLAVASAQNGETLFEHVVVDDGNPRDPWVKISGDLNGDGFDDLILGGQKGPVVWYAYPDWKKMQIGEGGYYTVDGETGDIDRDGDLDVVVGAEFWYENVNGDGSSWKTHRIADTRTHDIELADLDGDRDLDLVARDQSGFGHNTGNRIHIWKQNNPDSWTHRVIDCPHGEGLTLFDLDRDGDRDIVAGDRWFENTGDIEKGAWVETIFAPAWHADTVVKAGDLNGDGYADIVLTRSEGPYRLAWFKAPPDPKTPSWEENTIEASFDFAHGLDLADMDGDGDLDIVAAEMHQSERDRVIVFFNEGGGSVWRSLVLSTTGSHALRLVDIAGDGAMDIMGANWSGGFQPLELWLNRIPQRTQRFSWPDGDLTFYPIQHASFVMQWQNKTVFVDPVGDVELYRNFPKAHWILLTHEHGDHLSENVIDSVSQDSTRIVAPASVAEKLSDPNKKRTTSMANGDRIALDGVAIEAVPMYNQTPDRLRYHPKGRGNGYVLGLGGKRIYIAGDTEDIPEMRALRNIDVAFLCMNLPYTMTVEQAADAVREFQPKIVYPYHSRGSDLQKFKELVGRDLEIDVRILDWYAR